MMIMVLNCLLRNFLLFFNLFCGEFKNIKQMITLQQDANDKIVVCLDENIILYNAKKFFKWRKDISIKRINSLGTSDRDRFIKYLSVSF